MLCGYKEAGGKEMNQRPRERMRPPSQIFQERILPAYDEYVADSGYIRRANILAAAIDHHLEWTFEYYKGRDVSRLRGANGLQQFREMIYGLCPDLAMMKDLEDADKHRELRADPRRRVFLSTSAYAIKEGRLWGQWVRKAI
jgi:hypothetical protein